MNLTNKQMNYCSIEEMLKMIDEPNGSRCWQLLKDNQKIFQTARGSTCNHQAWTGGYYDHIQEIMNIVRILYHHLNFLRPLDFSLSDALLVTFLHDLEKPWTYKISDRGEWIRDELFSSKEAQQAFRRAKCQEYNIELTPELENGIKYIEGEHKDYTNRRRVMSPLAALCHLADVTSARIWFDFPLEENDPWENASRKRAVLQK